MKSPRVSGTWIAPTGQRSDIRDRSRGLGIGIGMGATTGGALGLLHHKGLGLDEADRERISGELAKGKAAVGVLAGTDEAPAIDAGPSPAP